MIFRVIDKGPGIPAEIKTRIFGLFESYPRGSRHRGAGLGLAIVRSLIALHGGTVSIESEAGQGRLSVVYSPPPPAPTARRRNKRATKRAQCAESDCRAYKLGYRIA